MDTVNSQQSFSARGKRQQRNAKQANNLLGQLVDKKNKESDKRVVVEQKMLRTKPEVDELTRNGGKITKVTSERMKARERKQVTQKMQRDMDIVIQEEWASKCADIYETLRPTSRHISTQDPKSNRVAALQKLEGKVAESELLPSHRANVQNGSGMINQPSSRSSLRPVFSLDNRTMTNCGKQTN